MYNCVEWFKFISNVFKELYIKVIKFVKFQLISIILDVDY